MVSALGLPLPVVFPETKPAQPAKPMLAMPSNSGAIVLKPLLMPFAERLVVTICLCFPRCRWPAPKLLPLAFPRSLRLLGAFGGGNWTSDEKEDKCAYTTRHCPLGQSPEKRQALRLIE